MIDAIKDYFKLLHVPTLLLMVAVQLLVYYKVIDPLELTAGSYSGYYVMNPASLALLIVATVFIAAGGFVINDYYDLKIDQINRPLTRVVGLRLDKHAAMTLYIVLSAIGLLAAFVLCYFLRSINFAFIFIAIVGMLWFYSSTYKRILWLGNIIAALLMSLVPLMVTLVRNQFSINDMELMGQGRLILSLTVPFAVMLMCWTFVAEIVKDMATEKGDRELECHTFPIVYGFKITKVIVTIAVVLTCVATSYLIPGITEDNGLLRFLTCTIIPALSLIYIIWKARNTGDYRIIAKYVLAIMALQLLYFDNILK